MRQRAYLSPSAIKTFYEDREKFYKMYLSDITTQRSAQTPPMAIGSGFDAYVKSYLYEAIFGKGHNPQFEMTALFDTQVEESLRDEIREKAKYVFDCYRDSGALSDLLLELNQASQSPQFEVELTSVINDDNLSVSKEFDDLTLLGKPDLFYRNKDGYFVVHDWKVNGFYAKNPTSPAKGYLRLREPGVPGFLAKSHRDCVPVKHNGMLINGACYLEDTDQHWAAQLAIYGWILGEPIGSDFLVAIDQLVCAPSSPLPKVRVAEHRTRVSRDYQIMTYAKAQFVWDVCKSQHVFRQLSKEDSLNKCKALDEVNRLLNEEPDVFKEFYEL